MKTSEIEVMKKCREFLSLTRTLNLLEDADHDDENKDIDSLVRGINRCLSDAKESTTREIWITGFQSGLSAASQLMKLNAQKASPVLSLRLSELAESVWSCDSTPFFKEFSNK